MSLVNGLILSPLRPSATGQSRGGKALWGWLAGVLIWLPAIAFLVLRATLPWDGAWISVSALRTGQVTVVAVGPGSALQAGDVVLAVAGRPIGEALRQAAAAPLRLGQPGHAAAQVAYLVERAGQPTAIAVSLQPGRLMLPLRRWGILLFGLVFQAVAALLMRRRPHDPAVSAIFLTAACLLSYSVLRAAELRVAEILSGAGWWLFLLLGVGANIGWQVGLVWLSLTFPRPHAWLRTRYRWALALTATLPGGIALTIAILRSATDPLAALSDLPTVLLLTQVALFVLAAALFVTNYRSLDADDRQRARWVLLAFLTLLIVGLILSTIPDALGRITRRPDLDPVLAELRNNLIWIAALLIPAAFVIAILRHRLFDIELVINRALVWGGLTALTMGFYVLIVGALSALFQTSTSPVAFFLATGVVAVLFQPVRQRLQRGVNRLMYGERDDPYAVLSRLGQRLGGALAPDAVAPTIVESIAAAFKLPYVALAVPGIEAVRQPPSGLAGSSRLREQPAEASIPGNHGRGDGGGLARSSEPLAAWGHPPAYPLVRLPLMHQGQAVGELLLAPRSPGENFSLVDRRLLDDLARQAGTALFAAQQTWQAQRLAEDLQRSRERLVTAREEERRRLRRDLHDGLGPVLASLTLKVDAARDELAYDAASAAEMLADLKGDIQAAVGDVRRLAYDLRPPALDDLGLAASLCLLAERYQSSSLTITCDLPADLPPLPAAVEVAIYRITGEALTNVVRHAGAHTCTVRLAVAERIELTIRDDGRGLPTDAAAGVGLLSMRERAAELGGECAVTSGMGGGTTVRVWLPLPGEIPESRLQPVSRIAHQTG